MPLDPSTLVRTNLAGSLGFERLGQRSCLGFIDMSRLWRSLLFVPAKASRYLEKADERGAADAIGGQTDALRIENRVTPSNVVHRLHWGQTHQIIIIKRQGPKSPTARKTMHLRGYGKVEAAHDSRSGPDKY